MIYTYNQEWKSKIQIPQSHAQKQFYRNDIQGTQTPIIIDFGTYQCRAGWAAFSDPQIIFQSEAFRPKSLFRGYPALFGPEIANLSNKFKYAKKSAFCQRNVIYDWKIVESLLDYTFINLGIQDSSVNYPILITQPLGKVPDQNQNMTQLMFECYGVSHLSFAVDSILSYYNFYCQDKIYPFQALPDSLLIDLANSTTNIVPYCKGKVWLHGTRRMCVGAADIQKWMQSSFAIRYPIHKSKFTAEIVRQIYQNLCVVAYDYEIALKQLEKQFEHQEKLQNLEMSWRDLALEKAALGEIEFADMHNFFNELKGKEIKKIQDSEASKFKFYKNEVTKRNQEYQLEQLNELIEKFNLQVDIYTKAVFQLPWIQGELISEEDLKKREDMRKQQGKRLKQINQMRQKQRKIGMENELKKLIEIAKVFKQNDIDGEDELIAQGFKKIEELLDRVKVLKSKLNIKVAPGEQQLAEESDFQNKNEDFDNQVENDKFALLKIPDSELTQQQIKYKRIQKMQKTAQELRQQKKLKEQLQREELQKLKQNPKEYLKYLYKKRKQIINQLQYKEQKRTNKIHYKRKGAAAQKRMQAIVQLGLDESEQKTANKGIGLQPSSSHNLIKGDDMNMFGRDDNFGQNDEDWAIYLGINNEDQEQSEGEDYEQKLAEIQQEITGLSDNFMEFINLSSSSSKYGGGSTTNLGSSVAAGNGGYRITKSSDFQITLRGELIEAPEIIFQPGIAGFKKAGLSELYQQIITTFDKKLMQNLLSRVFLTGGNADARNMIPRIVNDFRKSTPCDVDMQFYKNKDGMNGAWKGGQKLVQLPQFLHNKCISKRMYNECGVDYLLEHSSVVKFGQ